MDYITKATELSLPYCLSPCERAREEEVGGGRGGGVNEKEIGGKRIKRRMGRKRNTRTD